MKRNEREDKVADMVYRAYENKNNTYGRSHLGCSIVGHNCKRYVWYTFRWAKEIKHSGQLLRLFSTGNLEESRVISDLRSIGCVVKDVDPTTGRQFRVVGCNGHLAGSLDGVILSGLPGFEKTTHLLEIKTHNARSFAKLKANGVLKAKPQHFAQMQLYMGLGGLEYALYFAVNKNTDEIYTERVEFCESTFRDIMARAEYIINSEVPPAGISTNPEHKECKKCDFWSVCHGKEPHKKSCRTCSFSRPSDNGSWLCGKYDNQAIPDNEFMRRGCDDFSPIVDFEREYTEPDPEYTEYLKHSDDESTWLEAPPEEPVDNYDFYGTIRSFVKNVLDNTGFDYEDISAEEYRTYLEKYFDLSEYSDEQILKAVKKALKGGK